VAAWSKRLEDADLVGLGWVDELDLDATSGLVFKQLEQGDGSADCLGDSDALRPAHVLEGLRGGLMDVDVEAFGSRCRA